MLIIPALTTTAALFSVAGGFLHILRPTAIKSRIYGVTTVVVLTITTFLWMSLAIILGGYWELIASIIYAILLGYNLSE